MPSKQFKTSQDYVDITLNQLQDHVKDNFKDHPKAT